MYVFCFCFVFVFLLFLLCFSQVSRQLSQSVVSFARDLYFIFICSFNTFAVQFNWLKSSLLCRESHTPSESQTCVNSQTVGQYACLFKYSCRGRDGIVCIYIYAHITYIFDKTLGDTIDPLKYMYIFLISINRLVKRRLETFPTCKVYIFLISINRKVIRNICDPVMYIYFNQQQQSS